jgi:hypothetical protein
VNPTFLKLPLHDVIWMASEVFAILDDHFQHIYNYVPNSTLRKWVIKIMWPTKKKFQNGGKMGDVKKYS